VCKILYAYDFFKVVPHISKHEEGITARKDSHNKLLQKINVLQKYKESAV
jgi:hypothetical protein